MDTAKKKILFIFGTQHKMATWMSILMIAVMGCILCMSHASIYSLWLDECASVSIADCDFFGIPKALVTDCHPPLFYWILHIFLKLGRSEFVIRLPSILATIATGILTFLIGKQVRNIEYGFMSALLYISAHWTVLMSMEARNFSLATFFMIFSIWFIIRIIEAGTWKDWLGFQIMGICSIFSFYYGALFYVAEQILLGIYVIRRRGYDRKVWIFSSLFAAIPVLFWLPYLQQQMSLISQLHQEYSAYPVKKVIDGTIIKMLDQFLAHSAWQPWYIFLINHVSWKFYYIRWIFPVSIFLLALFGQWKFRQSQPIDNEVWTAWPKILFFLTISPVFLAFFLFIAGLFFINYRYMLTLSVLMAFVVVDGLSIITKKHLRWLIFGILLTAQIALLASVTYKQKKEEWRDVVAFVEENSKPEDCIAIMANYTAQCYAFYARATQYLYSTPKIFGNNGIRSAVLIKDLLPDAAGGTEVVSTNLLPNLIHRFKRESKVVLILSHEKPWGADKGSEVVIDAILQAGLREVQKVYFTGIKVYVFKR